MKYQKILEEVNKNIEPERELIIKIKKKVDEFKKEINNRIKNQGIKAQFFVGGSFAKGTIIKKEKYDVDIFLRYDKKYEDNQISKITQKLLEGFDYKIVHGSRDYFILELNERFYFEIVPVRKINHPKEAVNITDLSYLHVQYIKKKIKSKKLLKEIGIAKAFCESAGVYGAESYIRGFSGYSLELLIYHYKGFINFLRKIHSEDQKIIIDLEKMYKDKKRILMEMNSSKLESPIILVDPTFMQRNVLASLSDETFLKFREISKKFLKNPKFDFFEKKKFNIKNAEVNALKKGLEIVNLRIYTDRQAGDIAGSKLKKFFRVLKFNISIYFQIVQEHFEYQGQDYAQIFLSLKRKKTIKYFGPEANDSFNVKRFMQKHKEITKEKNKIIAIENNILGVKEIIYKFLEKQKEDTSKMGITKVDFI